MEEIKSQLVSPIFWFVAVVVGLIVNVAASYSKDAIEGLIPRVRRWAIERSEAKKTEFDAIVKRMVNDDEYMRLRMHISSQLKHSATWMMVLTVIVVVLPLLWGEDSDNDILLALTRALALASGMISMRWLFLSLDVDLAIGTAYNARVAIRNQSTSTDNSAKAPTINS